jgi:hypothetical protein
VRRGVLPILAGATAGVAVIAALATGVSRPELRRAGATAPAPVAPPAAVRREEIQALQLQVELLSHAVDALASEASALRAARAHDEAPPDPAPAAPPLAPAAPSGDASDPSRLVALEARLAAEAEDGALGALLTEELRDGLAAGRAAGASLRAASCSATLCRAEFALDEPASGDRALLDLTHLVPWDGDGILHVAGEDLRTAILYVAREGTALEPAL